MDFLINITNALAFNIDKQQQQIEIDLDKKIYEKNKRLYNDVKLSICNFDLHTLTCNRDDPNCEECTDDVGYENKKLRKFVRNNNFSFERRTGKGSDADNEGLKPAPELDLLSVNKTLRPATSHNQIPVSPLKCNKAYLKRQSMIGSGEISGKTSISVDDSFGHKIRKSKSNLELPSDYMYN